MAGRATVHLCVVENQVLKMDELTGDPHTGDGIEKVRPFGKAWADLGPGDALIEPRKRILRCRFHFPISIVRTSCVV
jgi:hypothetical protein